MRLYGLCIAVCSTLLGGALWQSATRGSLAGLGDLCDPVNPRFVVAIQNDNGDGRRPDPSARRTVVLANDSADDDLSRQPVLATELDTGSIFGLAYDRRAGRVFAAAYTKRFSAFGPGGPGAIYEILLDGGAIRTFAQLAAGEDHHTARTDASRLPDAGSVPWVGRSGLGDIEIADDVGDLLVVNLLDRRIHRLRLADGKWLGSFDLGSVAEPWAASARPLGLGYRDGWLYHGVVAPAASAAERGTGVVYRSRADGGQMTEALRFELSPTGAGVDWQPWSDALSATDAPLMRRQPMIAALDVASTGALVVGLRNRTADLDVVAGGGRLLLAPPAEADRWAVADPGLYRTRMRRGEDSAWGSLASFPDLRSVVATISYPQGATRPGHTIGLAWLSNQTGAIAGPVDGVETVIDNEPIGVGDVELVCPAAEETVTPPPTLTPSATWTVTPSPPTPTVTPTPSATRSPTATATQPVRSVYLPVAERLLCVGTTQHADIVVLLDLSTSMVRPTRGGRSKQEAAIAAAKAFVAELQLEPDALGNQDRAAVVGFNDRAWVQQLLTDDRELLNRALDTLPPRSAEGTRLDLAFQVGQQALEDPHRPPGNKSVLILLTDGLPNQVPTPSPSGRQEDTVLAAADAAKARGTWVYTVGLGAPADIDLQLLTACASGPSEFFYAPDGEDLAQIYHQIAGRITECPGP